MSVAHVTSATFLGTETTSGTLVIPAATVLSHDLCLLLGSKGSGASTAFPSVTDNDAGGNLWTMIGATESRKMTLWWKKATGASASKTITVTGIINQLTGGISVYSGGAAGNPITNWTTEANLSSDETHAGFTPDEDNSMICFAVANYVSAHAVTAVATATNPGALSNKFESTNVDASLTHASNPQVGTKAPTGDITWTQPNQNTRTMAWAIKPLLTSGASPTPKARITTVLTAVHRAARW